MTRLCPGRARRWSRGAMLAVGALALVGCTQEAAIRPVSEAALQNAIAVALSDAEATGYRDVAPMRQDSEAEPLGANYRARGYAPLWVGPGGLTVKGRLLLDRLSRAGGDALDPASYSVETIRAAADWGDAGGLANAEILLSRGLLRYAADMRGSEALDGGVLAGASATPDLPSWLDRLAPAEPGYRRLRAALADYRGIAAEGGWIPVPAGPALKEGDVDPRVSALRRRLAVTGDLSDDAAGAGPLYDAELAEAVARFQARHGLEADGRAGNLTLAALNRGVGYRISQIENGLKTLRGQDFRIGDRGVLVNIAAAEVTVVEDGEAVLTSRAIVGRPDWPTPTLRSRITAIEFNPPWFVPVRIALEEIVPKVRERGEVYLQRQGFHLFDGRNREIDSASVDWAALDGETLPFVLRQDPGPRNPLGRVKFLFANEYDVYLHDTPHRGLFVRAERTLSHGCIRLEAAERLAFHLLKQEGWPEERFRDALDKGSPYRVRLKQPIPVHLVSLTAWVDGSGAVQFREDPYRPAKSVETAADGTSCPADIEAIRNFKKTF